MMFLHYIIMDIYLLNLLFILVNQYLHFIFFHQFIMMMVKLIVFNLHLLITLTFTAIKD